MSRNFSLLLALCLVLPAAACLDTSGSNDEEAAPSVSEAVDIAALPTWPANPNWQSLVLGPSSDDVRPVRVVRTVGTVSNAGVLVGQGTGTVSLTVPQGGAPAAVVLDFGREVGGTPYVVRHRADLDQRGTLVPHDE
jgi:hypothetical protein